jgi:hypothetical protein
MQLFKYATLASYAFLVGACSPTSGDEDTNGAGDGDYSPPRPWEGETETGVAATGALAIGLSTGTFEADVQTSSFIPSSNVYRVAGKRTEEDLQITVEVAADSMVAGATLDCGPGGEAEVLVSMDLELEPGSPRAVFSSRYGPGCEVSINQFNGVGDIVSGSFSAVLVDGESALELYVYVGTFDTTRGSTY